MDRVFLFDGTGLAYKAYHAIKGLSTTDGFPTNAVYGFARLFLKMLRELKPRYCAVAFDAGRKTFRSEISKDYKANRKPTPDDFKVQLPYIKEFLKCLGVKVLELPGYEADDIIGTLAKRLQEKGFEVVIVTSDKDMKQLLSPRVSILVPPKGKEKAKWIDFNSFKEETGIEPETVPDLFGLTGDRTDNIPGVPGIGEKTALKLLREFKNLEGIYENLDRLPKGQREKLEKHRESAFKSRELARIETNAPVDVALEELLLKEPNGECLGKLIEKLQMRSLYGEIEKLFPNIRFSPPLQEGEEVEADEIKSLLTADLLPKEVATAEVKGEIYVAADGKFSKVSPRELPTLARGNKLYVFNLKELYHTVGAELKKLKTFDISLGYYLLNPLLKDYSPEQVIGNLLGAKVELPVHLHHGIKAGKEVEKKLKEEGLYRLYAEVEHPLSYVLYKMEKRGVPFSEKALMELERELEERISEVETKIFELAGEKFNLNSPKQLSKVLFEKLGLKPVKKTRSGYSTDVETLTTLALEGHEIAVHILDYRKLSKLLSSFVKALLKRIDETGRVHGKFIQTGTATGRLSSAEPNLQNLPVSDPLSLRVRRAVRAPEGYTLVWADYSQVELRILAHLSQDRNLIEAFLKGEDIHTETAKHLFHTRQITDRERRVAKTVNFGIIYGMSPHGLAERLSIPLQEAKDYIERYFQKFPKVREFIEETVREAYKKGFVETAFGRRRPLPELKEKSFHKRSFGERAAVNTVIQGTAADIMKMAMVNLQPEAEKLNSYIILQVHDELVLEAPEGAEEEVAAKVKQVMEGAANLSVPLTVEVKSGKEWS